VFGLEANRDLTVEVAGWQLEDSPSREIAASEAGALIMRFSSGSRNSLRTCSRKPKSVLRPLSSKLTEVTSQRVMVICEVTSCNIV
jgi:hypothetical protein